MQHVVSLIDCGLIVLCGPQGSGKTRAYELIQSNLGATRIDGKKLNHAQQMIFARYAMMSGNTVVVDCINATKAIRHAWIQLARDLDISVGLLYFDVDRESAAKRAITIAKTKGVSQQEAVATINELHELFYAQFETPQDDEGFDCSLVFNQVIGL